MCDVCCVMCLYVWYVQMYHCLVCEVSHVVCSLQMDRAGLALPNMDHVKKKEKDFLNAKNFDFTDEHVDHVSVSGWRRQGRDLPLVMGGGGYWCN